MTDVSPQPGEAERVVAMRMQLVERLLDRVEKAHRIFSTELWIYRVGCAAAMGMVLVAAFRTLWYAAPGPVDIGTFLGSGGLFAIAGDRTTRFLRENLQLLREVIIRVLPAANVND